MHPHRLLRAIIWRATSTYLFRDNAQSSKIIGCQRLNSHAERHISVPSAFFGVHYLVICVLFCVLNIEQIHIKQHPLLNETSSLSFTSSFYSVCLKLVDRSNLYRTSLAADCCHDSAKPQTLQSEGLWVIHTHICKSEMLWEVNTCPFQYLTTKQHRDEGLYQ